MSVRRRGTADRPRRAGPASAFGALPRHDFVSPTGRHLWVYGELQVAGEPSAPDVEPGALHQRHDALTDTWVVISPARNQRPDSSIAPAPDRSGESAAGAPGACPLCPGGAEIPFSYDAAVFDNRYPSLVADPPAVPRLSDARPGELAPALGRCEVVLYTERHAGSLGTLTAAELARVIAVWRDRTAELWADPELAYVLTFENRGEAVGTTISHPHGQIYAFAAVPPAIERSATVLTAARSASGGCLTCQVVERDASGPRVVAPSEHFVVAVPFAPHWPFEVHVRAHRHGLRRLADLTAAEARDLASALRSVVLRGDGLFGFELPYMMVALEGPADSPDWHLAFEFLPPHRRPDLLKHRASVETATGLFINDTLPETSAAALAAVEVTPRHEAPPLRAAPASPP